MSAWRRKAIEAAPELRDTIERSWSPMAAWIDLRIHFEKVVTSGDMQKALRIMNYARDCIKSRNEAVYTAVIAGFIEHLAENPAVRARLHELISLREVQEWREVLAYHAGHNAVENLEATLGTTRLSPRLNHSAG